MLYLISTPPRALDAFAVDRALGCLIGLAIGDAFGATLEGMPFDPLRLHTEMTGEGRFNLRARVAHNGRVFAVWPDGECDYTKVLHEPEGV